VPRRVFSGVTQRHLASIAKRRTAAAIFAAVLLGFAYSATATVRMYYALFTRPAASGRFAAIDAYFRLAHLQSAEELSRAVERTGWRPDEDVLVLDAAPQLSSQDVTAIYYSTAYALYPRRVWLTTFCEQGKSTDKCGVSSGDGDALAGAGHVLLIGRSNPFLPESSGRRLTDLLTLVNPR